MERGSIEMLEELTACLEAQQEPLKKALAELVRIPSVCDEGGGGYPFGEAVDQALRKALELAGNLGFRTEYGDGGFYGFAEVGEGKDLLGILGHLDVVPPGKLEDWEHDPFDLVEKDGMLYGRGTQEYKGPVLSSLFGVKALMDVGVTFKKRVRFIFGSGVALGGLTAEEKLKVHRPNERARIADLYKAMEIYAHAVYELTR